MNQIERLAPDLLLPEMQRRAEELLDVIIEKRKSLATVPEGHLRVAMHGKQWHCYRVTECSDGNGVYIPKSDLKLIKRLAQKDYDASVLKEMERELSLIEKFMKAYRFRNVSAVLENTHKNRRLFIEPIQLTDEEYAVRWLAQPYKGKGFETDAPELLTAKGERVRSKSEVIIADTLARHGVPYKYECPLRLIAGAKAAHSNLRHLDSELKYLRGENAESSFRGRAALMVYPDFTCLNLRTRKEFLWEHLGRMDDAEYAKKTVAKLRAYSKNGFVLGRNLIVTMECEGNPLNRSEVEYCVKSLLK